MVNIDAMDDFGWTPLMCAAGAGQLNAVAELLSRGANFQLADSKGRDARALAAISGHMGVVQVVDVCHTSRARGAAVATERLGYALAHTTGIVSHPSVPAAPHCNVAPRRARPAA
jgi:ankyrin repeat protein